MLSLRTEKSAKQNIEAGCFGNKGGQKEVRAEKLNIRKTAGSESVEGKEA